MTDANSPLSEDDPDPASQRLQALLTDPEAYFAQATARAWRQANVEVSHELALRAHQRTPAPPTRVAVPARNTEPTQDV